MGNYQKLNSIYNAMQLFLRTVPNLNFKLGQSVFLQFK
jgi:hypothetical protein